MNQNKVGKKVKMVSRSQSGHWVLSPSPIDLLEHVADEEEEEAEDDLGIDFDEFLHDDD